MKRNRRTLGKIAKRMNDIDIICIYFVVVSDAWGIDCHIQRITLSVYPSHDVYW